MMRKIKLYAAWVIVSALIGFVLLLLVARLHQCLGGWVVPVLIVAGLPLAIGLIMWAISVIVDG